MLDKYTKLYWNYRRAMKKYATSLDKKQLKLAGLELKQATDAFVVYYKEKNN